MSGDDLILLAKSGKKLSGVFKAEERAEMLESLRIQIKEEMKQVDSLTLRSSQKVSINAN